MNSPSDKKPTWNDLFDKPSNFDDDLMNDRLDDSPQERLAHIQNLRAKITPNAIRTDDISEAIKQDSMEFTKQRKIIELFGCMPSDAGYDYKTHRK